jgi:L-threonylcarbamoyladenylate synthase
LPYILDGGACAVGIESTIVGFDQGNAVIYRKGGLSLEKIEEQIGPVQVRAHSTSNPQAPGMLKSHYAPRIPLEIVDLDKLEIEALPENIGVISFQKELENVPADRQIILSESGDYAEAAQRLFAALRYLDSLPLVRIYAGLLPEEDLGRAINDRLRRAAAPQE